MSLVLTKVDYITVGVTSRGTTQLLPEGDSKAPQKFVVGDHDGIIHLYGMKKTGIYQFFKTLPGPKIERIILGGTIGTSKDKIFIAYGNSVVGLTKKGKMFLEFETSLLNSISAMYVLEADLAVCARDIYHRYKNCKDVDSYLVGEMIHDVILTLGDANTIVTILACNDRAIRVLSSTKAPMVLRLPSIPTVLALYREGGSEFRDRILVGTNDGLVGLLILQGIKTIRITWLLQQTGSEITALDTYELENGLDILIGRQDGTVQVFGYPDDRDCPPILRYSYNAGESISSVLGGIIGSHGYPEVLVTTFSGRIFGLTTKPPGSLEATANQQAIDALRNEILKLETKLDEDRTFDTAPSSVLAPLLLSVNHRMVLDRSSSLYLLSIELDTPIDNILIQSNTPIRLLDESNSAVISFSECNPAEDNLVLATYRCQVNTNRVEMKIRTTEGQSGSLQIYVTTQIQPKCCRKIQIPIHALSLHVRMHDDEFQKASSGPLNELKLNGNFSVAEMHAWLSLALPDISERPNLQDDEVTLNYVSTLLGTVLKCKYKKGSARFLSDSITTIMVLRDLLTKEATNRKIKLDVYCHTEKNSVTQVLEMILPRLKHMQMLIDQFKIIDTIERWEMTEELNQSMSSYYQALINPQNDIQKQLVDNSDAVQQLEHVIIDLYINWQRANDSKRISRAEIAGNLNIAIKSNSLEKILDVFDQK